MRLIFIVAFGSGQVTTDEMSSVFIHLEASQNVLILLFSHGRLCSAMKAYGVPWGCTLPLHPLHKLFVASMGTKGWVSKVYLIILRAVHKPLGLQTVWEKELKIDHGQINWHTIWNNITSASKNPNHQLIHHNFIHRSYLTPCRRYHMRFTPSYSSLCFLS